MNRGQWNYAPFVAGPEHLEAEVPIQYTIPFDWGDMHVTEAADKAYGIVPLTADLKEGFVAQTDTEIEPRTRVFLTVPGELNADPAILPGGMFLKPTLHSKGIELNIALGADQTMMSDMIQSAAKQSIAQAMGQDVEDLDGQITDMNDVPIEEVLRQDMPQMFIHGIAEALGQNLPDIYTTWQRVETNHGFYRYQRRAGAFALAGTGVLLLPSILGHNVAPTSVGFAASWLGIQTAMIWTKFKRELQADNTSENMLKELSAKYGFLVSNGVHSAFCRSHFDRHLEAEFPQPEE